MNVFVGQTRSRKLIKELEAEGYGEVILPDSTWPPKRLPYFADNGAFPAWKAGEQFNEIAFGSMVKRIAISYNPPEFLVTPDIVAGGLASLERSVSWESRLRGACRLYLAVQDGMPFDVVAGEMSPFAGIFVGGTLGWKLRTAEKWQLLARKIGKKCHVGRVGTYRRVRWACRSNFDSIDSSLPLWSSGNLKAFKDALRDGDRAGFFDFEDSDASHIY